MQTKKSTELLSSARLVPLSPPTSRKRVRLQWRG
ncbi:predicted protein [Plenodomus lingam JN3]|uniref:Predicted protein n=1 Tax=Leptosphaeria maculans (strain JN3 / isolate v23.1.3 / race Av1-4-5-6-7-8) TaxID=985895 RepID=E5AEC0_LEPMJ|nr:predicted protein [Plenodomus lingam JN3]CBY01559.1 predicted protein [Plenodomus lingam JN3]